MPTWTNNDGLLVKYGVDETTTAKAYEYNIEANYHLTEVKVTLASLATGQTVLNDNVTIPAGARTDRS